MRKFRYSIHTILFLISFSYQCFSQTSDSKPNIVYIVADDLGYGDLSCYGQKKFDTPNIDALAKAGMLFTQHYSGSTVCAPSRSSLLTGLHTGHTTIRGNKEVQPEGQYPIHDKDFTFAEMLKKAGYTTGAFGKWGLGYPGSEGDPMNQGFDVFYGYNGQRMSHSYYPYHLWSNREKVMLDGNEGTEKGEYAPYLIQKQALKFIDDNKDHPFFLFYPTTIPHAELVAPEEYMEKYRGKYGPEKPYNGVDAGPNFRNGGYASQPDPHAAFAAMINVLDDQVGEVVAKLKALGLMDNTIIIFTSDNGPHKEGGADPDFFDSNGPLRGYKRDMYEGGIRVPLIVRWDGHVVPGSKSDHISAFWDMMPTFCDLAGQPIPANTDGISFLPSLTTDDHLRVRMQGSPYRTGKTQKEHDFLYWEFPARGGSQAVRMGDWKGVRLNVDKGMDSPIELYNLSTDLGEKHNVAAANPQIVKQIAAIMAQQHTPSELFPFDFETKPNFKDKLSSPEGLKK